MIWKGKCFESIQHIEVAKKAQLNTLRKEDSRASAESGRDNGMSVLKARESILKRVHGNVSSTM